LSVVGVVWLSGRGLCDEPITRPEESYRLWCVVVCVLETSRMKRPRPTLGRSATRKIKNKLLPLPLYRWPGYRIDGMAKRYELDSPEIESLQGPDFLHPSKTAPNGQESAVLLCIADTDNHFIMY
jgi:hypothetical protein